MSRTGLVLAIGPGGTFVLDPATGATRDVERGATLINSSGATTGLRPLHKKDSSGLCNDFEAFVESPEGRVAGLGNPVNGDYGGLSCDAVFNRRAAALGDDGTVVVEWDALENHVAVTNAYAWAQGTWRKLPTLGGGYHTAHSAAGGVVVGSSSTPRAADFSYERHAVAWRDGALIDLTGAGGSDEAFGVNDSGQVVGQAGGVAAEWDSGRSRSLGSLPGFDSSIAYSIAGDGTAVGTSTYYNWQGNPVSRAVLFRDGVIYDLNDLVDKHDLPIAASRIADDGVIAAGPLLLVPTGAPLVPDRTWRDPGPGSTIIASGEPASGLALDNDTAYWITVTGSREITVKAAPKSGGPKRIIFLGEGFSYGNLAVSDGYAWFDFTPCTSALCSGDPGVWRVPVAGGEAIRVADGLQAVAMDASTVYSRSNQGQILATPRGGGAPVMLTQPAELQGGLAVDGGDVYFVKGVQDGNFHLSVLCKESGGQVTELSPHGADWYGGGLALDDVFIYLRNAGHLWRFSRHGVTGQLLATLPGTIGYRIDLALDGSYVYTVVQGGPQPGCVARVPIGGGSPSCVDRGGSWLYAAVRVDDRAIYFIRDTDIVRIQK